MGQPILGPFALTRPIGEGGMGQVWHAVHTVQDVEVAVKIITGERATDMRFIDRFEREVQAVAALSHPGICEVFDYGHIADTEALADSTLRAGSPWLAMRYAGLGTLEDHPPTSWAELRDVLLMLLDALAHAHARHMVHRDIKPGNVLLERRGDAVRCVITDFGLAHAFDPMLDGADHLQADEGIAGTPHYMAPELMNGRWRDYGPWTDLYALGCMAWELCSGAPPFDGGSFIELAHMHLTREPPLLRARFAIPRGFDGWLRKLIAKHPFERFTRAAEAVYALMRLGEPDVSLALGAVAVGLGEGATTSAEDADSMAITDASLPLLSLDLSLIHHETVNATIPGVSPELLPSAPGSSNMLAQHLSRSMRSLATLVVTGERFDVALSQDREASRTGAEALFAITRSAERLPLPWTWRTWAERDRSLALVGAGLGLFGLREIPFVGREEERDQIWEALRRVCAGDGVQVVTVQGFAGTGKTRLVEWIARRADEVGAAATFKVSHERIAGALHGLGGMLSAVMRCHSLERPQVYERLRTLMDLEPELAAAATELVLPGAGSIEEDGLPVVVRFSGETERHEAWRALLRHMTAFRAGVLWIDNAQWGEESLALVERICAEGWDELPLLIVCCVRTDALAGRPEQARLERIQRHERHQTISLAPLSPAEHSVFVDELLGLEPELRAQVTTRTQGNPMFAVQLVGDWVKRGVLDVGDGGFRLVDGASLHLPDSIAEVWMERLAQMECAGFADLQIVLELAAVLGHEVDEVEWRALVRRAGYTVCTGTLAKLTGQQLIRRTRSGFAFAHAMFHETLTRAAAREGRLTAHHRAAATLLRDHPRADHPFTQHRRALHLIEARCDAEAFQALHLATVGYIDRTEYPRALEAFDLRTQVAARMGLDPNDPQLVLDWIERAYVLNFMDRPEELAVWFGRIMEVMPGITDPLVQANYLRGLSMLVWMRGELRRAEEVARQSLGLFEQIGDALGFSRVAHALGMVLVDMKRADEALVIYQRGRVAAQTIRRPREEAWCLLGIASVHSVSRQYDEAEDAIAQATTLFASCGSRAGVAMAQHDLARVRLRSGLLDDAYALFQETEQLAERLGMPLVYSARQGLAEIDMMRGRNARARSMLARVLKQSRAFGRAQSTLWTYFALALCHARLGAWVSWEETVQVGLRFYQDHPALPPDAPALFEEAAQLARRDGEPQRAQFAGEVARWCAVALEHSARTFQPTP